MKVAAQAIRNQTNPRVVRFKAAATFLCGHLIFRVPLLG